MRAVRSQRPGCDIAVSGSWLAHHAGRAEWSNSAARGRPLVSQRGETQPETGRGRIARKGKGRVGQQATGKPASSALARSLWLNALPSPSGTHHAAPKLAHASHGPRKELERASNERGGSRRARGVLPSLEQVSASDYCCFRRACAGLTATKPTSANAAPWPRITSQP